MNEVEIGSFESLMVSTSLFLLLTKKSGVQVTLDHILGDVSYPCTGLRAIAVIQMPCHFPTKSS